MLSGTLKRNLCVFYIKRKCSSSLLLGLLCFVGTTSVLASDRSGDTSGAIPPSTGGDFSITHHTVDAGYAEISGGQFRLRGIVGQAEAGISEGNDVVFVSGFISTNAPLLSSFLFRDSFEAQ